jgi:hypothetical protein
MPAAGEKIDRSGQRLSAAPDRLDVVHSTISMGRILLFEAAPSKSRWQINSKGLLCPLSSQAIVRRPGTTLPFDGYGAADHRFGFVDRQLNDVHDLVSF